MSSWRTPDRGERVDDRVHHGGQGADRAGLARALWRPAGSASSVPDCSRVHVGERVPRGIAYHEHAVSKLARLAVVHDLLHQRLSHALRQPPWIWPLRVTGLMTVRRRRRSSS